MQNRAAELPIEFVEQLKHFGGGLGVQFPVGSSASSSAGARDQRADSGHTVLMPAGELVGPTLIEPLQAHLGKQAPRVFNLFACRFAAATMSESLLPAVTGDIVVRASPR